MYDQSHVDKEVDELLHFIEKLGTPGPNGKYSVKFGVLFNDDKVGNTFESLMGTLKAAKKKKKITYPGEILFQKVHDNVDITIL